MFKSYFKIAWRNLLKSKTYSLIHIAGLAIGMTVSMAIGLWIWDEISFNNYHENHRLIAQVGVTQTFNGPAQTEMTVAMPLGESLRTDYADDFRYVALASPNDEHTITRGDKIISGSGMWVQADFPVLMTLKMEKGNRAAMKDPSSLLLSASLAHTLFGDEDPLHKTIRLDNKTDMVVGGVYEDLPHNTSFYEAKFFLPWENPFFSDSLVMQRQSWDDHFCQLFVQLNRNAGFEEASEKIKNLTKSHIKGYKEEVLLHPMDKWHLYSDFKNGKIAGGRIQFVWLFGLIGLFVLLLACINFMNLSTARSEKRAKEVGVRKTVGSLRSQLISQFLSESVLVAFLSFIFSVILIFCLLPFFNELADKDLSVPWNNPFFWALMLGFTLFTGLIAGSYPAFYLSGFDPIKVLKGSFKAGRLASLPRKILVVFQFTISISLIIGSVIVYKQIGYAKTRPVGYSQEGLVMLEMNNPENSSHFNALKDNLLRTGVVENLTESSSPVTHIYNNNDGITWRGKDPNSKPLFRTIMVTHEFGKTVGWKIVQGRDFSRDFITDSGTLILNEAAVKQMGLTHPVGEIIKANGDDHDHMVTGVIKDMVTQSPYEPMKPTIYMLDYNRLKFITLRVKSTVPMHDGLAKIEPVFRQYNGGTPFNYQFVDNEYARKFFDEQRIGNLASCFAILAIFISCLGLLGLASFVAEMRTKEISVRKVLGASHFHLWSLLSREFVTLVLIACFIAIPVAWFLMGKWLDRYEYRTTISWIIFAAAAAGSVFLTLLTISFQTIRATLANPVKNLRAE